MTTHQPGLAKQNALLLIGVFIVFELLIAASVIFFVMLPMGRRSANDLASLMVLSAQTWAELPPETRADFELELLQAHKLALRAEAPQEATHEWHGPYLHFIEASLAERTGVAQALGREQIDDEIWLWAKVPVGEKFLAVGFPINRVSVQPFMTLLVSSLLGLILAIGAAIWLARRITEPLRQFEQAASVLGHGEVPLLLDESGPTEIAALARRFNLMAGQVRDLLEARTVLLAGLSHDLRTPLARMRLALALLEEQPSPRLISRVENDIDEMDKLIGHILDLARGMEPEAAVAIDLSTLLADMAADLSEGRVRVRISPQHRLFSAPPLALRRVIGNLLDNALRYGSNQPVELTGELTAQWVRIGVLDRGPGIPPEQMDAVFQPFYRVEASRSPSTGGSGLGLAIVRQLADTHGWQIQINPRVGGGLEGWLTLPLIPIRNRNETRKQAADSAVARQGAVDKVSVLLCIGIK